MQAGGQVLNRFEQQAAALGRLHPPRAGGHAGAALAKQLKLQQRLGQCGAIDDDQRALRPGAGRVHHVRSQGFARARFALQQHAGRAAAGAGQPLHHRLKRRGAPQQGRRLRPGRPQGQQLHLF